MKPQFYYDKNKKPVAVYLTIDDYNNFISRLNEFSTKARTTAKHKKKV